MRITLRRVLLGNALFGTACGMLLFFGAEQLAVWSGFRIPSAFFVAGLGLAAVAALLYSTLTQPKLNTSLALVVMILNAVCAVSGLIMLVMLWGLITERGRWVLGVMTALLGTFAVVEYVALRGSNAR